MNQKQINEVAEIGVTEVLQTAKGTFLRSAGPEAWNEEAFAHHQAQIDRYLREMDGLEKEIKTGKRPTSEILGDAMESIKHHQPQLDPDGHRAKVSIGAIEEMLPMIQCLEDLAKETKNLPETKPT